VLVDELPAEECIHKGAAMNQRVLRLNIKCA
jgi:hypothetical protein